MANDDLDFLDNIDVDNSTPPSVGSNKPLWQRKLSGFYAGKVTFAKGALKDFSNGLTTELLCTIVNPENPQRDVIQFMYGPKAVRILGTALVTMGVKVGDVKKYLTAPNPTTLAPVLKALEGKEFYVVQTPSGRFHNHRVYTDTGWKGLCATYGGRDPQPQDYGFAAKSEDGGDDDLF
jgi:hypothetical protein